MENNFTEIINLFSSYFNTVAIHTNNMIVFDMYHIMITYQINYVPNDDLINHLNTNGSFLDPNFIIYYYLVEALNKITLKLRYNNEHYHIKIIFNNKITPPLITAEQQSIWKFCNNEERNILQNILADVYTIMKVLHIGNSKFMENSEVVIFGGLIRDIIAKDSIMAKDIDIYLINKTNKTYRKRTKGELVQSLQYLKLLDGSANTDKTAKNEYQIVKLQFFDHNYDISYDIKGNSFKFYNTLDYTVNSLYFSLDGVLKTRNSIFSVDDCIKDIKNKKLVPIHPIENNIDYRKELMLSYGYN